MSNTIKRFRELTIKDVPLVGGKNASLGEMIRTLSSKGVRVPDGFAVTAKGYQLFIKESGLEDDIRSVLKDLNTKNIRNLQERGKKVRELILQADMPKGLEQEIVQYYRKLDEQYSNKKSKKQKSKKSKVKEARLSVAVRSSATAEDLPDASFAGQQETFLNVVGEQALIDAVKRCFASLFTDRAISYRHDKGFGQFDVYLSVGVQKMVRSDIAASGVMFSLDTESGFRNVVLINSIYGLGENIVQGKANPDEFLVFKPTLAQGYSAVIKKTLGEKQVRMVYDSARKKRSGFHGVSGTKDLIVPQKERKQYSITEAEALELARFAVEIEMHYGKPMDMEWAKDGIDGKLYIVQARPETVESRRDVNVVSTYTLLKKGKPLVHGIPVGEKIGTGNVRIILSPKKLTEFRPGDVLVTRITDPDWEPIMKIASAIVTDQGGRTSHAAIVSRELGIPAIVGCKNATHVLKHNQDVTVSCAEGMQGTVYSGTLPFRVQKTNIKNIRQPKKTKIMMNVGSPAQSFELSFLPNAGVGLAREEFIIAEYIKVHPLAALNVKKLKDAAVRRRIEEMTAEYPTPADFYTGELAEGIGMIAAAFYPKPVIVRFSDFKTNEYRTLIGGEEYEPMEENPMIGWRGASRYYDPKFRPAFDLECQAVKKVRDEWGLKNLIVMIPFCRTVDEGKKVLEILYRNALIPKERVKQAYHLQVRNKKQETRKKQSNLLMSDLQVYVMCEIPSNVILVDEFSKIFDGFSIGSNDLTQLTLGLDRDSGIVSHVGDERNPAVIQLLHTVIQAAKRNGVKIGICGQGPSDWPDLAAFLQKEGIDTMSLLPDTVIKTMQALVHEK